MTSGLPAYGKHRAGHKANVQSRQVCPELTSCLYMHLSHFTEAVLQVSTGTALAQRLCLQLRL